MEKITKRILTIVFIILMALAMVACGNSNNNTNNSEAEQNDTNNTISEDIETEQEQETEPTNLEQPAEDIQEESTETTKILVAYFSYSGNTKKITEDIQSKVGADIFEIHTVEEYPSDYNAVIDQAQQEQNDNIRPELNAQVENMDQYDIVYLGYPNWWGDMPMAVYTFLDTYDLSGKTVIPFCTHGGSGLSATVSSIANEEPDATVLKGLAIRDSSVDDAEVDVTAWLQEIGMLE